MSVITSHRVTPVNRDLNLKEYLIQNGYVHEQDLYSKKLQETVHLYHVLDYKKCNYEKAMEIRQQYKERYDRNGIEYTEEELDQLLYMPVSFTDDNFICWNLNYYSDDAPSVIIGSLLPNEQFIYVEYTEGKLNGSCYFKGPTNSCTKDGQKIEGYITRIIEDFIKEENDKQYKVKLPLFPTDKYFATFYIDKDQVQSLNVLDDINPEQDSFYKKRKNICIIDMDKQIPVYRTLKDGTRQKIFLSFRDIKSNYEFCKQEYKNKNLLNDKPKQNIEIDDIEIDDDIEME